MTGGWKCGSPDARTCVPVDGLRRIDPVADEVGEAILQLPGARAGLEVHARVTLTVGQQAHFA